MNCFHCRSNDLRLSRLHSFDIPKLFLLKIPVRCRSCRERFYASLFPAWKLGFSAKAARRRQHPERKVDGGSALV